MARRTQQVPAQWSTPSRRTHTVPTPLAGDAAPREKVTGPPLQQLLLIDFDIVICLVSFPAASAEARWRSRTRRHHCGVDEDSSMSEPAASRRDAQLAQSYYITQQDLLDSCSGNLPRSRCPHSPRDNRVPSLTFHSLIKPPLSPAKNNHFHQAFPSNILQRHRQLYLLISVTHHGSTDSFVSRILIMGRAIGLDNVGRCFVGRKAQGRIQEVASPYRRL